MIKPGLKQWEVFGQHVMAAAPRGVYAGKKQPTRAATPAPQQSCPFPAAPLAAHSSRPLNEPLTVPLQ